MDDYVIDGNLIFSDQSSALKFYREQYHKKKEWQGLTDEEVAAIPVYSWGTTRELIDAITAKLKEKNT